MSDVRRPGAWEAREALFQEAAEAARQEQENQPRQSERHAARMVVDAFGHQTRQPSPHHRELFQAFTNSQEGERTHRALERVVPTERENEAGMTRSTNRFTMRRDWSPGDDNGNARPQSGSRRR